MDFHGYLSACPASKGLVQGATGGSPVVRKLRPRSETGTETGTSTRQWSWWRMGDFHGDIMGTRLVKNSGFYCGQYRSIVVNSVIINGD